MTSPISPTERAAGDGYWGDRWEWVAGYGWRRKADTSPMQERHDHSAGWGTSATDDITDHLGLPPQRFGERKTLMCRKDLTEDPPDTSDFRPEGIGGPDLAAVGRLGYALGMLVGWALVLAAGAAVVLLAAWTVMAVWAVTFG